VCLSCFNGGCPRAHSSLHAASRQHPVALNIRRTRKKIERDEPPPKKLAIAAETDADRYDTALTLKCLECASEAPTDTADGRFVAAVEGILAANSFSRQEEVKAWEQELSTCEHVLMLQQAEARQIRSGELGHCSGCNLHENLWLCLECGNLGCGRKQMGGLEGNSHGLAHATSAGHGVAVKLGSITPEGTADIYCYKCDDERLDDSLGAHLAHWGIVLAERQKTEKSLTEMQVEQNLKWDFSMTTGDGHTLKPLFGSGLTGLKNLGNSCYLASIMQCLFDMPAFKERYYLPDEVAPETNDPAADLETQLRKLADGIWSGRYSKPDPDAPREEIDQPSHQRGLAPAMLKHLIGRGHAEFSTMRQQDAFEFLQHLFKIVTRSSHPSPEQDPTRPFRFVMEQRLQCLGCKGVRYTTTEQDNVFLDVPLKKVVPGAGETDDKTGDTYEVVTLKECLDNLTATEQVDLTCSACGSKGGYTKRSLFKTLPQVLAVNARKMTVVNWVPIKVDVPVMVPDGQFSMDEYLSGGLQPGETELPDETAAQAPAWTANAEALPLLEGMGFSRSRCERALYSTGNTDAETAAQWLFEHMDDADIDAPFVAPGAAAGGAAGGAAQDDPEKIEMLTAMGFTTAQARKALRETGNDMERAVEWVFSHPDDQGVEEGGGEGGDAPAAAAGAAKEPAGTAATPAEYQLQSIACHTGTSIHAG
jgi:ubiquitin carboxyl-terminal hydrolase 5/13